MSYLSFVYIALSSILLLYGTQYALCYSARRRVAQKRGCQPPPSLPQKDPIFGIDLVFQVLRSVKENRLNSSSRTRFETYGNTFQSTLYGNTKIFSAEPLNIQAVFAKDFSSWGLQPLRLFAFEPFTGKGIMNTDGSFWEHSRALIRPAFARQKISDFSSFDIHINRLIKLIPKNGSSVDLQPLFARLALDCSTEFLFGESVNSLMPETATVDAKAFLAAYNCGQKGVGRRMQLPQWNLFTRDKEFWNSCKLARNFVGKYVDKAILQHSVKGESSKYVLAYELVKETANKVDIRNQLLNVFLPAHEASAVALTNIFFHLARHPVVWTRLRQELLEQNILDADSAGINFERLKSLKYLQCVMNETFRLNPSIGIITRVALCDTTLPTGGGYSGASPIYVRRGDVLSINLYVLHRRTDLYGDNADKFSPQRWEHLRPKPWSYLPFGGGPRVCPGQQLALAEVAYTLVKFLQMFKGIENRDPTLEFVEQYKISTESKNGAKVALVPA